MKGKKSKAILILIIVLVIIVVIVGVTLKKVLSKNANQGKAEQQEQFEPITILESNEIIEDFTQNSTSKTSSEKTYIEMTEENYRKYNQNKQTFRIQDVEYNNDGTMTIKGRVYKYVSIPNMLTAEQYKALNEGKALNILGEKVVKVKDNASAKKDGYDFALKIESKEYKLDMIYYIQENENGTATVYPGSEADIADGTDIYMKITLNQKLKCTLGKKTIDLKEHLKNEYHVEDKNRTRLILKNDSFIFKNGKCTSIDFYK